jgi:succinate dehydrogenase/fumarate reductase flavoprotein subunit
MGGIPTNWKAQVMRVDDDGVDHIVPGLMAAGEAACASVHGANRLGANSLLDIVAFGRMAANTTKEILKPNTPHKNYSRSLGEESIAKIDQIRFSKGDLSTAKIRTYLQTTMQNHAAVFRIEKSMQEGIKKVDEALAMYSRIGITDRGLVWNTDLIEALELENLLCKLYI